MTTAQRFAQVFGAVYMLVGIVGFLPPLLLGSLPAGVVGPSAGLLLGLFAVNWAHSLAHILTGAVALATPTAATQRPRPSAWPSASPSWGCSCSVWCWA